MSLSSPIALIILDGWGIGPAGERNAIDSAVTPVWDALWEKCPHSALSASGEDVGLDPGQMGNSEVGHLNIGAGRVVYQDATRIHRAIEAGEFSINPTLVALFERCKTQKTCLHVMGLTSTGGVRSHLDHIEALILAAHTYQIPSLQVHAFLDGRDVPPKSAAPWLERIEHLLQKCGWGPISTISGRYWAMDRDKRWERSHQTYNTLTHPHEKSPCQDSLSALEAAYARGESDEFISPTAIAGSPLQEGDEVLFMNFRADRARQLCHAFVDKDFQGFPRHPFPKVRLTTLTSYSDSLEADVLFKPTRLQNTLGEIFSKAGLRQLRLAETEKYAHVTFFFNGGEEKAFENEERCLIPSPKIATYDIQPAMSAVEITDVFVEAINTHRADVIICNYANADMVGHTGMIKPTIQAIQTLDQCLGRVLEALQAHGGHAFTTADHGNAECMFDEHSGQPHTAHTLNLVPFIYTDPTKKFVSHGRLADCAPTILAIMGIALPVEMTGHSLLA